MTDDWNLRADILAISHRWPVIVAIMLAGSLLGFLAAWLLPGPYRAEAGLQVSFYGDLILRNPDDYKNWQLGELDVLTTSEPVLQRTLELLRQQDPAWQTVEPAWLASRLRLYWRNAGQWRLVAEHPQALHSQQLVLAWRQAVVEAVANSKARSLELPPLNAQINSVTGEQAALSRRSLELQLAEQALQAWLDSTPGVGEAAALEALTRWRLFGLAARLAANDQAGRELLANAPDVLAPQRDYRDWAAQALSLASLEKQYLAERQSVLQAEYDRLAAVWQITEDATVGLSVYLDVKPLDFPPPSAPQAERPGALMGAAGSLLGLIAWLFFGLARSIMDPTRRVGTRRRGAA